jgi:hypothetical protein
MGLRDLFETTLPCPVCRSPEARRMLFGRLRCRNPECPHHDPSLLAQPEVRRVATTVAVPMAEPGTFELPANRIVVRYRNFRGERKRFEGDPRSLRFRGQHVSLRVAPSGRRIALNLGSIDNRSEIESLRGRLPGPEERKILTYHTRRGTTSARFEELRRRYPDWSS